MTKKPDYIKRITLSAIALIVLSLCSIFYMFASETSVSAEEIYDRYFVTPRLNISNLEGGGTAWLGHSYAIKFDCKKKVELRNASEFSAITLEAHNLKDFAREFPAHNEKFEKNSAIRGYYRAERSYQDWYVNIGKDGICFLISRGG